MLKILLISLSVCIIMLVMMRLFPRLRIAERLGRLSQNPLIRTLLIRGLWRLIQLIIFRR